MSKVGTNRKSLRATNIELHGRDLSVVNDDSKIHTRDYDNLYPLRMEKVINNSPTGKRSANLMAKYIVGDGVIENGDTVLNKKGETLNDIADLAAGEIARQYGVFFFVTWKFDVDYEILKPKFVPANIKVLDSILMAKSKADDNDYPGKFYRLEMMPRKEVFKKVDKKTPWYYPYNSDPVVILAQMKNDCRLAEINEPTVAEMAQHYRGQVYYLNLTPKYHYALPPWDSVYDDMDTEYRIAKYNNNQARTGWLGKTVVKKFDGGDEENNEFNEVLKQNIGAENSADVIVVDVPEGTTDDLNKAFVVDQLKAQFDDKLFESTKKSIRQNIAGNFNNVPEALLFAGTGALFGPSADSYIEMKKFYWEQNEYERFKLEKTLHLLTGWEVDFKPIKGAE